MEMEIEMKLEMEMEHMPENMLTNRCYLPFIGTWLKRLFSSKSLCMKAFPEMKQFYQSEHLLEPLEIVQAHEKMERDRVTYTLPII